MYLGGLQKCSLVDFPGKIAAVVFTSGCNFRCPFCQNAELVKCRNNEPKLSEKKFFDFLAHRLGILEGVVVTGGEPTIQKDLPEFLANIKALGYKVKLDTNGSNPVMLENIIKEKLADFIAMDIKGPLEKYDLLTGVETDLKKILKSISLIENSNVGHQFRTTFVEPLLSRKDKPMITELLDRTSNHIFQDFVYRDDLLNPSFIAQMKAVTERN